MSDGSEGDKKTENKRVIDFVERRAKRLEEKRRKTERVFFNQILGIYCVTGDNEYRHLEIQDVSEEGLSFKVPFNADDPWPKDEKQLTLRLYFSQDTYVPLELSIQNSSPFIDEGVRFVRYGCAVDKNLGTYEVYLNFIKFLKLYSEHAHKDSGKVSFFYL